MKPPLDSNARRLTVNITTEEVDVSFCDRCGKQTIVTIMSTFNKDIICLDCKDTERNHPKYQEARQAEENAVRAGDYNFPGIGKPADL